MHESSPDCHQAHSATNQAIFVYIYTCPHYYVRSTDLKNRCFSHDNKKFQTFVRTPAVTIPSYSLNRLILAYLTSKNPHLTEVQLIFFVRPLCKDIKNRHAKQNT